MTSLDALAEALVVHPGDKLLVRVAPSTSRVQVEQLMEQARERLPEVEVVIIGAEQLAVLRD